MWTSFFDMHSGGGTKEPPYECIHIEAPRDRAMVIFYKRFGHNPERVSCTCCGQDYSISEAETLKQATGHYRNAPCTETKRDPKTGLYDNGDPNGGLYLDRDELPPPGYRVDVYSGRGTFMTVEEYLNRPDVLVIREGDIKPGEDVGEVPEQGYVWVGDDD